MKVELAVDLADHAEAGVDGGDLEPARAGVAECEPGRRRGGARVQSRGSVEMGVAAGRTDDGGAGVQLGTYRTRQEVARQLQAEQVGERDRVHGLSGDHRHQRQPVRRRGGGRRRRDRQAEERQLQRRRRGRARLGDVEERRRQDQVPRASRLRRPARVVLIDELPVGSMHTGVAPEGAYDDADAAQERVAVEVAAPAVAFLERLSGPVSERCKPVPVHLPLCVLGPSDGGVGRDGPLRQHADEVKDAEQPGRALRDRAIGDIVEQLAREGGRERAGRAAGRNLPDGGTG